jgi:hypothetical protein
VKNAAALRQRRLQLQTSLGNALIWAKGHQAPETSAATCFHFGDFAAAHDHFQKTVELYDQTRHGDFANRFGQDPRAAAQAYDADRYVRLHDSLERESSTPVQSSCCY